MKIDVLEYLVRNEPNRIEDQLQGSKHDPAAALGVAEFLIGHQGNISLLSEKQRFYWDAYLKPLLHEVPCEGVMNDTEHDTCTGNGFVDEESLLLSYQEGEFVCQLCRYDREKISGT